MDYRFPLQLSPVPSVDLKFRDEVCVHGLAVNPETDSFLDRIRFHGQDAPAKHQRRFFGLSSYVHHGLIHHQPCPKRCREEARGHPHKAKAHNDSTLSHHRASPMPLLTFSITFQSLALCKCLVSGVLVQLTGSLSPPWRIPYGPRIGQGLIVMALV